MKLLILTKENPQIEEYGWWELWTHDKPNCIYVVCSGEAYCRAGNKISTKNGNPTQNPVLPYGHTPSGEYKGYWADSRWTPTRTYGMTPVLTLDPIAGQAHVAKVHGGRTGLGVHGGDARGDSLRPTAGCVRLSESDMAALFEATGGRDLPVQVVYV